MGRFIASRCQKHTSIRSLFVRYDRGDTSFLDKEHTFSGHIIGYRFAGGSKYLFIDLFDGTIATVLRCMCDKSKYPDGRFDHLFKEACRGVGVFLSGTLVKSPPKATQFFELHVSSYDITGPVLDPSTYLLAAKETHSADILRVEYSHLRDQTMKFASIGILKKYAYRAICRAMEEMEIGRIDFVGLTESDCEGGSDQLLCTRLIAPGMKPSDIPVDTDGRIDFQKDFFGRPVYETCSAQLELEYATIAMSAAYIWTRATRAEPSTGPRHLATFDMLEWEIVCRSLDEDMDVAVQTIKAVLDTVLVESRYELDYLAKHHGDEYQSHDLISRLEKYYESDWPVISHEEAVTRMIEAVQKSEVEFEELPTVDGDLTKQHERYITEKMFPGLPVFVTWYPKKIKSFYMPTVQDDPGKAGIEHADGFDLLFPVVGEVVGGSMRESDYTKLITEMDRRKMKREPLKKYIDIRKDGSLPHGGAGIGFARLMMVITGILQAKDMVEMPRSYDCFA